MYDTPIPVLFFCAVTLFAKDINNASEIDDPTQFHSQILAVAKTMAETRRFAIELLKDHYRGSETISSELTDEKVLFLLVFHHDRTSHSSQNSCTGFWYRLERIAMIRQKKTSLMT